MKEQKPKPKQFSERSPLFHLAVEICTKFSHIASKLDEEARSWFLSRAEEQFATQMLHRMGWDIVSLTTSLCELEIIDSALGTLCGCLESDNPDRNIKQSAKALADNFERDLLFKAATCVGTSSSMSSNLVDQCKVQAYARHADAPVGVTLAPQLISDLRRLAKDENQ